MSDRAAEFLAAREHERTASAGGMSVRLGAGEIAVLEKWRRGRQSYRAVVAALLAIADERLSSLQHDGDEASSGRA